MNTYLFFPKSNMFYILLFSILLILFVFKIWIKIKKIKSDSSKLDFLEIIVIFSSLYILFVMITPSPIQKVTLEYKSQITTAYENIEPYLNENYIVTPNNIERKKSDEDKIIINKYEVNEISNLLKDISKDNEIYIIQEIYYSEGD